ncbi:cation:proton antiporter, partial [Actinomadura fulvescens]
MTESTTDPTAESATESEADHPSHIRPPGRRRLVSVSVAFAGIPVAVAAAVLTTLGADGREGGGGHQGLGVVAQFLLAAALVLLAAWAGGRLAVRLGQPPVMGEIVAGIALGPSLLGVLSPETMRWLFPDQVRPMLSALAQLGLVLFMFEVGRELAAVRLRGAAHSFVLVAVASMSVPFATGMAAAPLLAGSGAGPAGTPAAFALFLGVALSVTAFPVLARILTDLGLTRTLPGRMSLFAAAGGDGVAWLMLAVA